MVLKLNTFQLKIISYESAMPCEKLKMTWEKKKVYVTEIVYENTHDQ